MTAANVQHRILHLRVRRTRSSQSRDGRSRGAAFSGGLKRSAGLSSWSSNSFQRRKLKFTRSSPAYELIAGRLTGAGVLTQETVGRRNHAFEALELIEAVTALERQIASPEGDTVLSEPIREHPVRGAEAGCWNGAIARFAVPLLWI